MKQAGSTHLLWVEADNSFWEQRRRPGTASWGNFFRGLKVWIIRDPEIGVPKLVAVGPNGRFSCCVAAKVLIDCVAASANLLTRALPVWALSCRSLRSSSTSPMGRSRRCAAQAPTARSTCSTSSWIASAIETDVRRRLGQSEALNLQCCFDFPCTFSQGRVGLIDAVNESLSPVQ